MPGHRSLKKGPFIHHTLLTAMDKVIESGKNTVINTKSRASTIIPKMIGLKFGVHNGREFVPIVVSESMVGHKLGEFVFTRLFRMHAGDRKAK